MAVLPEDDRELVSALTDASYLQRRISSLAQHYRQILLSLCSLDPSSRSLDKTLEGLQSLGATAAFTVMRNQERVIQTQRETIITIGDKVERIESKVNGIDEKVDLVLSTLRTQFASLHQSVSASFSLLSSELVRDREGLAGLLKLGEEMAARILSRLEGGGLFREEIVSLLSDVKDSINDHLNDRTGEVLSAFGVLAESAKRTDLKSEDTNYLVAQLKSEVAHLTNSVGLLIESTNRIECNQRAIVF